jgi:hypothetical protein
VGIDEFAAGRSQSLYGTPIGSRRRKSLLGLVLPLTLALVISGVASAPRRAGGADGWADFERSMATFDPLGRYLLRPIEKELPGLALTGAYYLWSDFFVGGHHQVGFRNKDYRAAQTQNLLELELRYRLSPGVEITSVNHLLYDPVYNLQDADGLYATRVDEEYRFYDDGGRIAREFYVSYRTPRLDVVIGKQQIAWGKMDGRFIDVINGIDARESAQLESTDYEVRRMPAWMANVTYIFGGVSLNVLWIPDFEGDRSATYGSPWFSPLIPPDDSVAAHNSAILDGRTNVFGDTILHDRTPGWGPLDEQEYAVRLDVTMGALTWGLIYYYAWDRSPDDYIIGRDASGPVPILTFERRYSRLQHYGFTADYATALSSVPLLGYLPVVLRVEALLTRGVRFTDYAKQARARAGLLNSGLSERDTLRAALAFEFAFPMNTTVIFQPSFYGTFNWRDSLGPGFGGAFGDEWALVPLLYVERPIRATRDRLRLGGTVTPYFSGPERGFQGVKLKLNVAYEFSQFIKGRLVYTSYSGGDGADAYGQYRKWDTIGIELQYEF